ncbi:hypothetical protein, partial [Geobacillus sp.]|uniref:hypothetical protein n=1 Tax=Geobacillus sp. TaxID=1891658 RepID=UPI0025801931
HQIRECGMLVHREHLLGLFVSLLTFYRKGALFSIPFGFYWIINTPDKVHKKKDIVEKYSLTAIKTR